GESNYRREERFWETQTALPLSLSNVPQTQSSNPTLSIEPNIRVSVSGGEPLQKLQDYPIEYSRKKQNQSKDHQLSTHQDPPLSEDSLDKTGRADNGDGDGGRTTRRRAAWWWLNGGQCAAELKTEGDRRRRIDRSGEISGKGDPIGLRKETRLEAEAALALCQIDLRLSCGRVLPG
ncbi:hypothetical protein Dimus_020414, partial [Dionaea muscipula]